MVSITNADLEIYVTENSVTTVIWKDNARVLAFGDVVRITDRDGIRYEFLYTDVIAPTSPAYSSAEELADEINTYLITIPGGGGGINLETNGTPNGDQTLLNLVEGTNMTITDDGFGNITFDATGSGGSGTVTSVSATVPSPASPALSVLVTNPTTTPAIAITANGTTSQYFRGDGSLATFPTIPTVGNSIQALTGDVTASASSPSQSVTATLASNFKVSQIVTVLDGQGGVIQIGRGNNFLSIPFNGTITGWTVLSSVSGSIEVAFWKDTYANYPPTVADNIFSPNPSLTSTNKNQATGLNIAVTAGDIIIPNVVSVTTCTNVTIAIQITRS